MGLIAVAVADPKLLAELLHGFLFQRKADGVSHIVISFPSFFHATRLTINLYIFPGICRYHFFAD